MTDVGQTPPASSHKLLKTFIALFISAALLLWLWRAAQQGDHWQALFTRFETLGPWPVMIFLGGMLLTYLLRAGRVFDEFRQQPGVRFVRILRLTLIHNTMINVLPFRSGEASFPLLLNRWFGVPHARAIAALLWLRLQDAFVVCALAAFIWPNIPIALRLLWISAVGFAAWWIPRWARAQGQLPVQSSKLQKSFQKLRQAMAESTHSPARAWLWTAANWSIKLFAQAYLLATLLSSTWLSGLAGAMGVELAAILPIQGVAGFGTYEAGGAALLRVHGISLQQGLQASLLLHLAIIASALSAGLLAWLCLPKTAATTTSSFSVK